MLSEQQQMVVLFEAHVAAELAGDLDTTMENYGRITVNYGNYGNYGDRITVTETELTPERPHKKLPM